MDSYKEKEWIWILDVFVRNTKKCGFSYVFLEYGWLLSLTRDYEHLVPAGNRLAVEGNDKSLMALDYWDKAYINGLSFRCSSTFLSLSHKPKWTLSLGWAFSIALGPNGSRDYRSLIGSRVTQVHAKWAYNGNLLVCYPSSNIT